MLENLIGMSPLWFCVFGGLFIAFGIVIGTLLAHGFDACEERRLQSLACQGCFAVDGTKPFACRGCARGIKWRKVQEEMPVTKKAIREANNGMFSYTEVKLTPKDEPKEQES